MPDAHPSLPRSTIDKLELDDRVSRLEHRMSILTALILTVLLLFGISASFLLVARFEPTAYPAVVAHDPPMVLQIATPHDVSEGSVGHLVDRLRDLTDLRQKGLLTDLESQAKRDQLLAKPIRPADLRNGLEQVAALQKENVLTGGEHATLKAKILEAGK